jgi:hypothetical protein
MSSAQGAGRIQSRLSICRSAIVSMDYGADEAATEGDTDLDNSQRSNNTAKCKSVFLNIGAKAAMSGLS